MRKVSLVLFLCLALFLTVQPALAAPALQTSAPLRDDDFEREVIARLAQISPEAVPVFQQATANWDAENYEAARAGFMRALELAPSFPDALRRLANVEMSLNLLDAATEHARAAYAAAKTPANATTLAEVLLAREDAKLHAEALTLAKEGAAGDPQSDYAQIVLVQAAAAAQDLDAIKSAVNKLLEIAPDSPISHYFAGLLAMDQERWADARAELDRARELGLPEEVLAESYQEIDQHLQTQATQLLWLKRLGIAVGAWFVAFGLLFLAGLVLSRVTLAAVGRPRAGDHRPGPAERFVRSLYAGVIAAISIFFYVSLPLVAVVIILAAAGLIYVQLRAPRINLYLLAMTGIVGFYTVLAIARSTFVRAKQDEEPGRPLTEAEAPRLWALTREIAQRCGTRPVDAIFLTPAVEVAVTERGGLLKKLRGQGKRLLIIGMGALPGTTEAEFAAILAHEYGHFSNKDTAGGNLAHQVNLSMHTMAYRLAAQGLARWYNPAWWFINGFSKVFYRATLGASRLQEILADRFAAMTYGAQNLINGLTRIVRQDLAFDMLVERSVRQSTAQGRALPNFYKALAQPSPDPDALEAQFTALMNRPTGAYDSHPSVADRIRLIQAAKSDCSVCGSDAPASDLFADMPALQESMMAVVQGRVMQGEKAAAQQRAAELRQAAKESMPEVNVAYINLAQAVERQDHQSEAEGWDALAEAHQGRELYARAANCYGTAADCYADLGDKEGERVARYNRAESLKELKAWAEAETELRKVVALDEALDCPDLESDRAELAEVIASAAEAENQPVAKKKRR